MEEKTQTTQAEIVPNVEKWYTRTQTWYECGLAPLTRETPLSKYLAMALFVVLPFLGFWLGVRYAAEQEKYVSPDRQWICNPGDQCCEESLRIAQEGEFGLVDGMTGTCLQGYRMNMLRCESSVRWCEPGTSRDQEEPTQYPVEITDDEYRTDTVLYKSSFGVQGMTEELVVRYDGTWTYKNNLPGTTVVETKGTLSLEVVDTIVALLTREGVNDMEIVQLDDWSMVCDGSNSWEINIDGKSKRFNSPCVGEKEEDTKRVLATLEDLDASIMEIVRSTVR